MFERYFYNKDRQIGLYSKVRSNWNERPSEGFVRTSGGKYFDKFIELKGWTHQTMEHYLLEMDLVNPYGQAYLDEISIPQPRGAEIKANDLWKYPPFHSWYHSHDFRKVRAVNGFVEGFGREDNPETRLGLDKQSALIVPRTNPEKPYTVAEWYAPYKYGAQTVLVEYRVGEPKHPDDHGPVKNLANHYLKMTGYSPFGGSIYVPYIEKRRAEIAEEAKMELEENQAVKNEKVKTELKEEKPSEPEKVEPGPAKGKKRAYKPDETESDSDQAPAL